MEKFKDYLTNIENEEHRDRMEEVLTYIKEKFPNLQTKLAWNQPMFTDHGTFIIGFSVSKKHIALAPEKVALKWFAEEIDKAGYDYGKEIIRLPWDMKINYPLLDRIIEFNIEDKANTSTFWRI